MIGKHVGTGLGIAASMIFGADLSKAFVRMRAAADKPLPRPLGL